MRAGDEACRACFGGIIPCKGGGNMRCWKRNPSNQHIAIVVDSYGGDRVIVGTPRSIREHVRPGELVHFVPKLIVHEPIAWNDIPIVIERARLELDKWLDTKPNTLNEARKECATMWRLRRLELHGPNSLNLFDIVET